MGRQTFENDVAKYQFANLKEGAVFEEVSRSWSC